MALLFLLLVVWSLLGICGGLGILLEQKMVRPADQRHAWFLIFLTFAGIAFRGIWHDAVSWPLITIAAVLTYHLLHTANVRARRKRLRGRPVPHT